MRHNVYYYVGMVLVGAAVAGLVISAAGIVGVWRVQRSMVAGLDENLALLDTTLRTTADGLAVAEGSLDQAEASLSTLVVTLETSGRSISDTVPLVEALAQVTTRDLPETLSTTTTALESAQSSARLVDASLRALTSVPLLGIQPYAPRVPLSTALGEVADSLEPLPASLASMEGALTTTAGNLHTLEAQFDEMAAGVEAIGASLSGARGVVGQYGQVVGTLQQQLALSRATLPGQLASLAWYMTVVLVWLGLTQVGLMMQGFEMMGLEFPRPRVAKPEAAVAA